MSFMRPRSHRPDEKRKVVLQQKLGAGNFGVISTVKEFGDNPSLNNPELKKPAHRERVVKQIGPIITCKDEQGVIVKEITATGVVRALAQMEYEKNKDVPHLHVKSLVEENGAYYLVMDRIPGKELLDVIDDIFHKRINLSDIQFLRLAIAIVNALQKQVHDIGMVHRDIKPENIMVDLSDPDHPIANIIDFGLAKNVTENDSGKPCGTPSYLSPEVKEGRRSTQKSDVFSLGITFYYLFFCKDKLSTEYVQINDDSVCSKIYPALAGIKKDLRLIVEGMCESDPNDRSDLDEVLTGLHRVRVSLKSQGLLPAENKALRVAHQDAMLILAQLKEKKSFADIKELIAGAMFPDYPVAVDEFVETLGMRCLQGCHTKTDILKKIEQIEKAHNQHWHDMNKMCQAIQAFKDRSCNLYHTSPDYLTPAFEHAERKFEKYKSNEYRSLDEFVYATERLEQVADRSVKYKMIIEDRCRAIYAISNQRQNARFESIFEGLQSEGAQGDKNFTLFKNIIKFAISNYLQNYTSDSTIQQNKRAASQRRINDMHALLTILNSATSIQDAQAMLEARLKRIKTGFFGSSVLRDEVKDGLHKAKWIPRRSLP